MNTGWIFLGLGVALLCVPVRAEITIYGIEMRDMKMEVPDEPALFGPSFPFDGLRGLLVYSTPANACTPVLPPPKGVRNIFGKWFLLVMRDFCQFEDKVRNAQAAGYHAVIVHNYNSSSLEPMNADNSTGIAIPAAFIGAEDGIMMRDNYLYPTGCYACITYNFPFDITSSLLLIFSALVAICFLGMVVFIIVKYFRDRRRARRDLLPKRSLAEMTVHIFRPNDPFESCAICLDEFRERDKLRVLPCMHAYHKQCIDPWLTGNKRVCPVCKRIVLTRAEHDSDSSSDDSEDSPLLGPSTSGGESSFERVRRNFLSVVQSVRTNASISGSVTSRSSGFSDNDSYHSVTEINGETRSLLDEPSVNA